MSVETLNARVFAIFAFCFILVLCLVLVTAAVTFLGFYLGVYSLFGNSVSTGADYILDILWATLALLAAWGAFIGSKRAYRVAIKYQEEQKLE